MISFLEDHTCEICRTKVPFTQVIWVEKFPVCCEKCEGELKPILKYVATEEEVKKRA